MSWISVGRIVSVKKMEIDETDALHRLTGKKRVHAEAIVHRETGIVHVADFVLCGYEPEVVFQLGQKVTITVEEG